MSAEQTLAFVAFAVVVAGTPGPSNTLLTAVGANAGVVRGIPAALGVACGMAALMFAVTFGVGALILQTPFLVAAVKWLGAAVLLWLAWKIVSASTTESHSSDSDAERPVGFAAAAAFQWVNPKSWLACTSAAAAFQPSASEQAIMHAATLAAVFALVALPSCVVWLGFGAMVHRVLRSPKALRAFNLVMAALLLVSIGLIFLT